MSSAQEALYTLEAQASAVGSAKIVVWRAPRGVGIVKIVVWRALAGGARLALSKLPGGSPQKLTF